MPPVSLLLENLGLRLQAYLVYRAALALGASSMKIIDLIAWQITIAKMNEPAVPEAKTGRP
jgi:hypothetical protein